jgi:hypothetical protein
VPASLKFNPASSLNMTVREFPWQRIIVGHRINRVISHSTLTAYTGVLGCDLGPETVSFIQFVVSAVPPEKCYDITQYVTHIAETVSLKTQETNKEKYL